jgi:DNA-directed RNA polymerase subunit RPC12/RpoP
VKIKKFTCISCGAPKVNPYKSPYIMCDYCGSFTDIDFTLAMDLWNERTEANLEFVNAKADFHSKMTVAYEKKDKQDYLKLQKDFWNYYYKTFPYYLPPSLDNESKYNTYLNICAESGTDAAFDGKWAVYANEQNALLEKLVYELPGDGPKVQTDKFFNLAEFFIKITKEGIRDFYSNPRFAFVNDFMPEQVQLKMKLTVFVQAWVPYLTEDDVDRFLKMSGFSMQYVQIEKPVGKKGKCSHCSSDIFIPAGAYKVFCEACRKSTKIHSSFKCMSCGSDNDVPDNPGRPIDCAFCGVENRLIHRLFG